MDNHEFCDKCGESSFHRGEPCNPEKKRLYQNPPKFDSLSLLNKLVIGNESALNNLAEKSAESHVRFPHRLTLNDVDFEIVEGYPNFVIRIGPDYYGFPCNCDSWDDTGISLAFNMVAKVEPKQVTVVQYNKVGDYVTFTNKPKV